jgi:hypothetical protein
MRKRVHGSTWQVARELAQEDLQMADAAKELTRPVRRPWRWTAAGAREAPTVVNLLGVQVREWLHFGFCGAVPATDARESSWQGAFGPDVEWQRK